MVGLGKVGQLGWVGLGLVGLGWVGRAFYLETEGRAAVVTHTAVQQHT